jgi:hypothetical protein
MKRPPPVADLPSGRGAGLIIIALLATVAIALAFVDSAVAPARRGAPLEAAPGFYALFGAAAAMALAMLARLTRIILGRADVRANADKPDAGNRA